MKIYIPGKKAITIYPSGGMFVSVPGQGPVEINKPGIKWLLRDEFSDTLAAGSVNGTLSDSGHVRTVVDANGKLLISGGYLTYAPGGTGNYINPCLDHGAITRVAGRVGIQKFNTGGAVSLGGLGFTGNRGNYTYDVVNGLFTLSASINISWAGSNIVVGPFLAINTDYISYSILRSTGLALLLKGGIYTSPTLLYISNAGTTANQYLGAAIAIATNPLQLSFYRIPQALWLPVPLLSTSGAMTWPTTNGLGHAEGVAGGIGAGGGGLTMLDMGSWAADGTYVTNTPVVGVEKVTDPGFDNAGAWAADVGWVVAGSVGTRIVTIGTNNLVNSASINSVLGQWYQVSGDVVRTAGGVTLDYGGLTPTFVRALSGSYLQTGRESSVSKPTIIAQNTFAGTVDNYSVKHLPISSLITNCQLATTDVLAEMVIHAYTLGSQVGWVQSDRAFACKFASSHASGETVISLAQVTAAITTDDTLTIESTTYVIASVTGGANVAYNATTKTQTVTLGANLGAEVLADAKVGLDWAAWNGQATYYDGAGNIKLDEVKAGVWTNRGSTASAFSADKRFIVRKISSEYRIFAGEALIGSAISTVDAASMVGKYWGLFSTLAANQITSCVLYDTGNVTDSHNILNKYSQD